MLSEVKETFILYEDENDKTKTSSYKYSSIEVFEEFLKNNGVDMSKVNNARIGE